MTVADIVSMCDNGNIPTEAVDICVTIGDDDCYTVNDLELRVSLSGIICVVIEATSDNEE